MLFDHICDDGIPIYNVQADDELIQELNRMKWENKRLNGLLATACKNYEDLMQKQSAEDRLFINSSKRKFDEIENINVDHVHICRDECRPKEIKSNVSRVHVRIDPSDTNLVSLI